MLAHVDSPSGRTAADSSIVGIATLGIVSDEIKTISRDELKAKLDRGDDFRLVMTLHEFAFRATHIPGSEHYPTIDGAYAALGPNDNLANVHGTDESLPIDTLDLTARQFVATIESMADEVAP